MITFWDLMIENEIIFFLKKVDASKFFLLDIGCGAGKWDRLSSQYLSPKKDLIAGLDLSKYSLLKAKRNDLKNKNTNYVLSDASRIPFASKSFNVVLVICLMHHLSCDEALQEVLYEIKRLTEPNSSVLIVENTIDNPLKNLLVNTWKRHKATDLHLQGFTSFQLIKLLKQNGFRLTECNYENLFLVYACTALGLVRILLPNRLILSLHKLENRLVQCGFWRYCGTIHLIMKTS